MQRRACNDRISTADGEEHTATCVGSLPVWEIEHQLGIIVTAAKHPRSKIPNGPTEVTKICVKFMQLIEGSPKHPGTILVRKANGGCHTLRYRMQPGFYPGRCNLCHRVICACEELAGKMRVAVERRTVQKNRRVANTRRRMADTPEKQAADFERMRKTRAMRLKCKQLGLCPHY